MIKYRKATLLDIPAMQILVKPEIESGVILKRDNDEVATNIRSYHLAFDDERLVGFCALHIHTMTLAEVRSLIVDISVRGTGVGSNLIKIALEEAKALGLKEVLSLTYQQAFFEHLDFKEIPKESLPEHKIWADCINCKHFPICNEVSLIHSI
ncbi:MAG: N-acetyltransferase [Helicobacteraceae bacterium]|jgi:amino-acid N-acetyltransferase|nr:N-acetyltransferase [Helicobacteraceae bacterium]